MQNLKTMLMVRLVTIMLLVTCAIASNDSEVSFSLYAMAGVSCVAPLPGNHVLGQLMGTVAGGVGTVTSFTQQYLPQFMYFSTATSPDINIKVSGDGTVWDITGIGVNEFATIRQFARTTNYYLLQLGSGLLKNKTVTYTITNQTATAFNVYGMSRYAPSEDDYRYCVAASQVILASSGVDFTKFAYLAFPSAGATDRYNIDYADGTSQPYDSRDELKSALQSYQGVIATGYNVDNVSQEIVRVQAIPAAQQTMFVLKYAKVGGLGTAIIARG